MCLWSGVMELVSASGLAGKIERMLRPALRRLFGHTARDRKAMELVSANVTANLLGLSNAATPIGLQAVSRLYDTAGGRGAPDAVLMFIAFGTIHSANSDRQCLVVRAGYAALRSRLISCRRSVRLCLFRGRSPFHGTSPSTRFSGRTETAKEQKCIKCCKYHLQFVLSTIYRA